MAVGVLLWAFAINNKPVIFRLSLNVVRYNSNIQTSLENLMCMDNRALYPGTFDPVTNGHLDIIGRAAKLYPEVVVAVAANAGKSPVFTLAQRMAMLGEATAGLGQVRVVSFDGLLVACAKQQGAQVIVRGLRTVADFEFERQMAGLNRHLDRQLDTVFLMPAEQFAHISSSMIREIARYHGDVSAFVPDSVQRQLQAKFNQE